MEPVRIITGTVVPLDRSDVDTDQIIPSDWLKRVERSGFGAGLFAEWRDDRGFVLNRPEHAGASILAAGANFGIGSSREHAVWALLDHGFRAVVAPRFGDIFRINSGKSGLVTVQVSDDVSERLMAAVKQDPSLEVTIDVERRLLAAPSLDLEVGFPLDDFTRDRLLAGLDDIDVSLSHAADIDAYERTRAGWLPTVGAAGAP